MHSLVHPDLDAAFRVFLFWGGKGEVGNLDHIATPFPEEEAL